MTTINLSPEDAILLSLLLTRELEAGPLDACPEEVEYQERLVDLVSRIGASTCPGQ